MALEAIFTVVTSNRQVLPLLAEVRWHNPATARLDDATYMAMLLQEGWCLSATCPEPPFHCHLRQGAITNELRRLMR